MQPPSTQPPLSERPKLQCRCCGAVMLIVRRRIAPIATPGDPAGHTATGPVSAAREAQMTLVKQRENRHRQATCLRGWWRCSAQHCILASSHPCNEGGRGNNNCQRQPMWATRRPVPAKLPEDVFCASHRHVIRARPTTGSDRGKRDLTLFVRHHSSIARYSGRCDTLLAHAGTSLAVDLDYELEVSTRNTADMRKRNPPKPPISV